MDFNETGPLLFLLLLIQMHCGISSAGVQDQPYQDTWLTGFEVTEIDGQPAEPACKIISVTDNPPTTVPKTTTTTQPITAAQRPNPTKAWQPSLGPQNPHPGFVLVPFFLANGRPAMYLYDAGSQADPISNPQLPGNRLPPMFTGLLFPGNRNRFPNYSPVPLNPTNPLAPSRTRVPGHLSPASRLASLLRSGLARSRGLLDSDSSEEYRG